VAARPRPGDARRPRRDRLRGQAASFFTALTLAPAGLVALLLYLNPAIVALLAAWRGHETLTRRTLLALAIALTGTALTIGPALTGSAQACNRPASRSACSRR
jgi:drug/metabolite transporter (DMT)-like permease